MEKYILFSWSKVVPFDPSDLFCADAESFRLAREAEEEQGTITKVTDIVKSYYDSAINTASGYLESIKGLKLEEKAK